MKMVGKWVIFTLIVFCTSFYKLVWSAPAHENSKSNHYEGSEVEIVNSTKGNFGSSSALNFLRKYGYLEALNSNSSETLYSEERISVAIKLMQKFGAISETGRLDDETLMLLKKPRCGVKDIDHSRTNRFVLGSKGWNKRVISYRIDNWSSKLDYFDVSKDIRKALDIWAGSANLRFTNKSYSDKADISISFGSGHHGDKYPFDGPGGTLAHAFYPQNNDDLGGDIHFDEDESWYSPSASIPIEDKSQGISFLDVAIHELGHSLGLGHSHIQTSVMFPYYQAPNSEHPRLDYDDIMALYHLYILRNTEDEGSSSTEENRPTERSTTGRTRETSSTESWTTRPFYTTRKSFKFPNPTPTIFPLAVPDLCKQGFDTISYFRSEIFVFKGEYMWRFLRPGQIASGGYPTKTSRHFPIVKGIDKIDAVFERDSDNRILFFSGKSYWTSDGSEVNSGPHSLTEFGLPESLDRIDAAFVWGKNSMTYFFKDDLYWKYNETIKRMENGYPKNICKWRGIPDRINSVFRYKDDRTYFFKDNEFWRFDDIQNQEEGFPMKTSQYWFNC